MPAFGPQGSPSVSRHPSPCSSTGSNPPSSAGLDPVPRCEGPRVGSERTRKGPGTGTPAHPLPSFPRVSFLDIFLRDLWMQGPHPHLQHSLNITTSLEDQLLDPYHCYAYMSF